MLADIFFSAWNCSSQICSTGTNCEPAFLHRYSVKSAGRHVTEIAWEVACCQFLHHGSAPFSLCLVSALCHNGMTVAPHPQHSPCLAPYNIFVFLKLKLALKGRKFNGINMIQEQNSYHLCVQLQRTLMTVCSNGSHWADCVKLQGYSMYILLTLRQKYGLDIF